MVKVITQFIRKDCIGELWVNTLRFLSGAIMECESWCSDVGCKLIFETK